MAQQFNYPKSEYELRAIQDRMYAITKKVIETGDIPRFKGLLEIMMSEVVINTAIHNIKANKGSQTPGTDGETIRKNFLEIPYEKVIERVREGFRNYEPRLIRRKYIPKAGKKGEYRPLGIPTKIDMVIQECVRIVIEPILEAQFFRHSYGFRPMRNVGHAVERLSNQSWNTGYHWIIEGDISKFFDTVNHRILIKKLWHMGVRDQRVLMIVKEMLKAGVMNEFDKNEFGTPQGGIISPLLANVYLHSFDEWVTREWENKKTQKSYSTHSDALTAMRRGVLKGKCKLKPCYLVRYADDWVLICDSHTNAVKWKNRIAKYLNSNLKIKLSEEKTHITNIRKIAVKFLGFTFKDIPNGKARFGYSTQMKPNRERVKPKIKEIRKKIRKLRRIKLINNTNFKEELINEINKVNSVIRGVIQYYSMSQRVNMELQKYDDRLVYTAYKAIKPFGGKWTKAKETSNLIRVHSQYESKIPAIEYNNIFIGITRLMFARFNKVKLKNQAETPYSSEGRKLYYNEDNKREPLLRMDDFLSLHLSELIATKQLAKGTLSKYNFEYFMNRAYAFNRDRGKCRACSEDIWSPKDVHIHHVRPYLPLNKVNRVDQLATMHKLCHERVHSPNDFSHLYDKKSWKKILDFREKLINHN